MSVYRARKDSRWAGLDHSTFCHMQKLGLRAGYMKVIVALTKPQYLLVCMKTKPVADLAALSHSTHQFA